MTYPFVYVLRSRDYPDETYIGQTNDIYRRLVEHNTHTDSNSHTFKYRPWYLDSYVLIDGTSHDAEIFERYLKSASGQERIQRKTGKKKSFLDFFRTLSEADAFGKRENRMTVSSILSHPNDGPIPVLKRAISNQATIKNDKNNKYNFNSRTVPSN